MNNTGKPLSDVKRPGLSAINFAIAGSIILCAVAILSSRLSAQPRETYETATFGGGCFWCMQPPFDKTKGVIKTTVGYMGGHQANPTYAQVSSGTSGHAEVLQVTYDNKVVSYADLLAIYWRNVDPLNPNGQFCDSGSQYRSVIYTHTPQQEQAALKSRENLIKSKRFPAPIVTEVRPATTYYLAEAYHQDYYKNNPIRYKYYRNRCGRDERLQQLWGSGAEPEKQSQQ